MRISLKLGGTLAKYLPPGAGRRSRAVEVAEDATIDAVLGHLRVPSELVHLVLVNGVRIPRAQLGTTSLHAQDTLAIWPPLSGG